MATTRQAASPPSGAWIEHAGAELRRAGLRSSAPRTAVLELIGRQDCVLSAQEIAERLSSDGRRVGVATVYRTLDLLEELGLIGHTHLGHGAPVYHLADDQHLHVVCHRCESVVSVDPSVLTDVVDRMQRDHGFRVDVGHVTLSGECADCRAGSQ